MDNETKKTLSELNDFLRFQRVSVASGEPDHQKIIAKQIEITKKLIVDPELQKLLKFFCGYSPQLGYDAQKVFNLSISLLVFLIDTGYIKVAK